MTPTDRQSPSSMFGPEEVDKFYDYSSGHVAEVRKLRQAARLEMEKIGNLTDYEVRKIVGRKKPAPSEAEIPAPKLPAEQCVLDLDTNTAGQP